MEPPKRTYTQNYFQKMKQKEVKSIYPYYSKYSRKDQQKRSQQLQNQTYLPKAKATSSANQKKYSHKN